MSIDAHFHCWQLARGDYGWLTPALAPIYRDVAVSDWQAQSAPHGVTGGVLVQAAPTEAETAFLLAQADAHPAVLGVVGWVDLAASDAPARIEQLARHPRLKGLRPMLQDMPDAEWILHPALAPALRAMADCHLVFDALVKPVHLPHLLTLAGRHPDLRIVIDHAGKPDMVAGPWQPWAGDMARLASQTGACCKLSGLLTEAGPTPALGAVQLWAAHVLACFGADRLVWGSDWPVLELAGSYGQWFAETRQLLASLSPQARDAVMDGNARRLYRLPAPSVGINLQFPPHTTENGDAPMKKPPALQWLPDDGLTGTLVGRAWVPGQVPGPSVIVLRPDGVYDLSAHFATMSDLLDAADPVAQVRAAPGRRVGSIDQLMPGAQAQSDDPQALRLLAPCDLQVIKAAGVTFAASLIERVIEEQARGDAAQADAVRQQVVELLGGDLAAIRPGSPQAMQLKALLIHKGLWSQYLEVGIGPDAEVFTKAPVLSSVGSGAQIGIHPGSAWNNPEPEIVLAVNSRGDTVGASLGNDVNLRDFEGRSALLLGKAKDNNASCAIGPFIRLFDASYCLDDVRRCTVSLQVEGLDGFALQGSSSMAQISRDPLDLVAQTLGAHHQYPDGVMLFLGTLFAPTQDRGQPGSGFTHQLGDVVQISSPQLGRLVNEVNYCDRVAPWTFGLRAFYANLCARGLLAQAAGCTVA